jgi:hypothetical protein
LLILVAGCFTTTTSPSPTPKDGKDENAVRGAFTALQEAIEKDNADRVLALLDDESRTRFEQGAKDKGKSVQNFVKDDILARKPYNEYPEGKVSRVTVQGDTATTEIAEPDGDRYKLTFVREGGQWKLQAPPTK